MQNFNFFINKKLCFQEINNVKGKVLITKKQYFRRLQYHNQLQQVQKNVLLSNSIFLGIKRKQRISKQLFFEKFQPNFRQQSLIHQLYNFNSNQQNARFSTIFQKQNTTFYEWGQFFHLDQLFGINQEWFLNIFLHLLINIYYSDLIFKVKLELFLNQMKKLLIYPKVLLKIFFRIIKKDLVKQLTHLDRQ
ncbi:hypothetical protein IMG5_188360 [Ichthyophthirius multifiliis]|uniref:Uncharacterized protein n=1 Tax=Ichthyophthirius multifiliis TaxID=5932 RepID=G0R3X9_ICHMU|nr:hypothetical protein IMG5_188360 [Ichthyophthirius multifiliis]EGR27810.1 hypothetical protein IMG5_188360 [Ichthyophthirius multifiliis]|eukprot:XP_004027155.1 hypothetical protein IMG5_188360 [Ichthyophthirius multifiliis]